MNATYIALIWELIGRTPNDRVVAKARRIMHIRSLTTLCVFAAASVVALKYPLAVKHNLVQMSRADSDPFVPRMPSRFRTLGRLWRASKSKTFRVT